SSSPPGQAPPPPHAPVPRRGIALPRRQPPSLVRPPPPALLPAALQRRCHRQTALGPIPTGGRPRRLLRGLLPRLCPLRLAGRLLPRPRQPVHHHPRRRHARHAQSGSG